MWNMIPTQHKTPDIKRDEKIVVKCSMIIESLNGHVNIVFHPHPYAMPVDIHILTKIGEAIEKLLREENKTMADPKKIY